MKLKTNTWYTQEWTWHKCIRMDCI